MALYFDSPQDLGRTLDNGFAIYRASVKPLLLLSFLTAAIINLPSVINYALVGFGGATTGAMTIVTSVIPLVGVVLYLAGYVGLVVSQDAIARGAEMPALGEAFNVGFRRLWPVILMALALMLLVMIGFVLLVVPGVILSVSLGFGIYLVALDGAGPLEALQRSHKLVWGQWWRTMVVITVAVLLYGLPLMLIGGIVGFTMAMGEGISASGDSPAEKLATLTLAMAAVQIVTSGLLMPLMNGFMLAQLNDLKLRKSGADLLARAPA
jgi:hypothetical protein